MGSLILIAWYTNGRFSKIETSITWIEKFLNISKDNDNVKAFGMESPISLTSIGNQFLSESGLKDYIDNKPDLLKSCESKKWSNPYEVQQYIFDLFDKIDFPKEVDEKIKKYAFQKGLSTDILKRVGAIYFRDVCLQKFDMKTEDIDKHDPTKLNK